MNCIHTIINIVNYLHECKINVHSKSYFVGKKYEKKTTTFRTEQIRRNGYATHFC